MNRKTFSLLALSLAVGALVGAGATRWILFPKEIRSKTQARQSRPERRILYWRNPMNPSIHADHPMKDNMGMEYIPVYAEPQKSQENSGRKGMS